jgi:hypothetical protein
VAGGCGDVMVAGPTVKAGPQGIQVGMEPGTDFVALLRRWEDAGGLWRVLGRAGGSVTVGLYRCDGGEETDRFVATDPRLTQFLAGRTSNQNQPRSPFLDKHVE